jgi:catechol 2,3-dioxygenase-like lactoylglutathione lyase family enzyme
MNISTIREAVARGWCTEDNKKKVMDPALAEAISGEVGKLFPKFEQVAFYVPDMEGAKARYRALGCREWVNDTVTAIGKVGVKEQREADTTINVANLAFNYDLGTELELIQYVAGDNWHEHRGTDLTRPFLSHMSYHVEDMAGEQNRLERAGFKTIQNVRTISHTNEHLLNIRRKYQYVIFDTRDLLGFDVKLIRRLEA